MKKILTSIMTIAGIALFAVPAMAATTANITPATVSVAAGQTFTVSIAVNPNGSANYAEKIEIKYPANTLEVRGFTLAPSWTALNQPGYDVTDNANGVLVKTAGYASGFTSTTVFGTVTFYAKTAGTASITFGSGSTAFEAGVQTALVGTGSTVTIGTPVVVPVVAVTPGTPKATPAAISATSTDTATTSDLTAALGDTAEGKTGLYITLGIIALIVIGGVAYFATKKA